jgi:hypothetical protein
MRQAARRSGAGDRASTIVFPLPIGLVDKLKG